MRGARTDVQHSVCRASYLEVEEGKTCTSWQKKSRRSFSRIGAWAYKVGQKAGGRVNLPCVYEDAGRVNGFRNPACDLMVVNIMITGSGTVLKIGFEGYETVRSSLLSEILSFFLNGICQTLGFLEGAEVLYGVDVRICDLCSLLT